MARVGPIAQLVRVANLPTAAADVVAGFLVAGGTLAGGPQIAWAAIASVCLYAAGTTLNDVADARADAVHRPKRPIPSGAVTRRAATWLSIALATAGCGAAAMAGMSCLRTALVLLACIIGYDLLLKRTCLAPSLMGLCRSLNFLLGAGVVDGIPIAARYGAIVIWLYVASLTLFARRETAGGSVWRLRVGMVGLVAAPLSLVGLRWTVVPVHGEYLLLVGTLIAIIVIYGRPAVISGAPSAVQRAVTVFVLSIVLLDACIVLAIRGPAPSALTAMFAIPAVAAARMFRVT